MAYEQPGAGALDYAPCRYGASKLVFRGPRRSLDRPYVAALGGTETYGKFLARPWPMLLEARMGCTVVNLGCVNGGVGAYLSDPDMIAVAAGARLRVVQVTGVRNTSNRFYTVHPRRNDRFIAATPALRALYPEVDFTAFSFTRHLTATLHRTDPVRFARVAVELRRAWVSAMRALLGLIGGPTVLLLLPDDGGADGPTALIDAATLATLPPVAAVVSVAPAREVATPWPHPPEGRAAGLGLPGPATHEAIAARLAQSVRPLMQMRQ